MTRSEFLNLSLPKKFPDCVIRAILSSHLSTLWDWGCWPEDLARKPQVLTLNVDRGSSEVKTPSNIPLGTGA